MKKIIQIEGNHEIYSFEIDIASMEDFCDKLQANDFLRIQNIYGNEMIVNTKHILFIGDEEKKSKTNDK